MRTAAGRRMTGVLGALLAMSLGAGCSDGGGSTDKSTTTSTVADSSSTTRDRSTTSSTSTGATIDAAGVEGPAEWVPIVVDVYERIHRLDTDPDPARITEVYSENYEGLAEERETTQFLADEGLRAEGQAPRIIKVEGPSDDGTGTQQFVVTVEYFPFTLVRADGSVFQEIDDVPGRVQEVVRISPSGADGTWRVLVKTTA